jgi:hypothetical protein
VLAGRAAADDDDVEVGLMPAPGLVDLVGGRDQADVAVGLREVAELLAVGRVDLLAEQAEVVRVAGELLEQRLRALDLAGLRQAGHEPERADDERALLADRPSAFRPSWRGSAARGRRR